MGNLWLTPPIIRMEILRRYLRFSQYYQSLSSHQPITIKKKSVLHSNSPYLSNFKFEKFISLQTYTKGMTINEVLPKGVDLSRYVGQWVVICKDKVVAHHKSLTHLEKEIKGCGLAPTIAKIPKKDTLLF